MKGGNAKNSNNTSITLVASLPPPVPPDPPSPFSLSVPASRLVLSLAQIAIEKKARIAAIQQSFDLKRDQITRDFEVRAQLVHSEFATNSYDLTQLAIQAELKEKLQELQNELKQHLDENEAERNRALLGV